MDALALKGDEGRGVAAISFGEMCSNLRSEDFRMGKPKWSYKPFTLLLKNNKERTWGSETSQYPEEKKTTTAASQRKHQIQMLNF